MIVAGQRADGLVAQQLVQHVGGDGRASAAVPLAGEDKQQFAQLDVHAGAEFALRMLVEVASACREHAPGEVDALPEVHAASPAYSSAIAPTWLTSCRQIVRNCPCV
jgi:hypothetical protein